MVKILIVEDEHIIALDLQARLKRQGYDVVGAVPSGEKALERAAVARPDLVLMDITLEGNMDGVQAGKRLREGFHIPVIYLTAHVDEATMQRAKITHPFGYLVKPYEEKTLHRTIQMALYTHQMEQKLQESQERLQASEERYRSLVLATTSIVWTRNPEGAFVTPQPAWQFYTGQAWEEHRDFGWKNALHPEDREKVVALWGKARDEQVAYEWQARLWHDASQQYHYVIARGVPIRGRDGMIREWVGLTVDIHEKWLIKEASREAEQKLADLNRDLEEKVKVRTDELRKKDLELAQAQRLEAIGRLAGGVAHDFNNLMTGIRGISQDLQASFSADDPRRADTDAIIQASNRAFAVTRQLLAFGRRQVINPRAVDPNAIVLEVNKLLRRLIGEDIKINLGLGEVGPIKVDPIQLEQIILNLTVNARDAMPQGGTITLRTAEGDLQDGEIDTDTGQNHLSARPGRYVMLEVADTGSGMDSETMSHIFEPFFTTKEKDKGTGLGLATVYGIVKQSGGHIRISSQPHQGTSLKVYFPRVYEPLEPPHPENPSAAVGGGETILVVEDEDIVRRVVVKKLRQKGYNVLEARNGHAALEVCSHTKELDLIVTDIIMPEMNGREVIDQARQRHPHVAVIYMSGYPEDIITHRGILEPGIHFVEKSSLADQLPGKIREILAKRLAQPTGV